MAVAFDAVFPDANGADVFDVSSVSWDHTATSNTNGHLRVAGSTDVGGANAAGSATYGGNAMTTAASVEASGGVSTRAEVFSYIGTSTSPTQVVWTFAGAGRFGRVASMSYTGASQSSPNGSPFTATGLDQNPTVTVTDSNSGDMVTDGLGVRLGSTTTITAGQTQRFQGSTGGLGFDYGASQDAAGGGSVVMGWSTGATVQWALAACTIFQAGGGGGATQQRLMMMGVGP